MSRPGPQSPFRLWLLRQLRPEAEHMDWRPPFRAVGPLSPQFFPQHFSVFVLTLCSHALYHCSRKTFSSVKMTIADSGMTPSYPRKLSPNGTQPLFLTTTEAILLWGSVDSIFLFSYALGLYIMGKIHKWISLPLVMAIGMCSSALVTLGFGTLSKLPYFYNKWFYFFMSVLNGLIEPIGWPCMVAIMDSWFGITGPCFIFVLWIGCTCMGNVLGAFMSSLLLHYGCEYTFLVTASMQVASGLILFTLWLLPQEHGPIHVEDRSAFGEDFYVLLLNNQDDEIQVLLAVEPYDLVELGGRGNFIFPQPLLFLEPPRIPGVLPDSLACAIRKVLKYTFFFWLPFYLNRSFRWLGEVQVSQISIWYDMEAILDGTFQGLLSDVDQKRSVLAVCVLLAIGSLTDYRHVFQSRIVTAVLISGLFFSRPSNSCAISSNLCCQEHMHWSREALATVTGIVDRTISTVTAMGQYFLSLIQDKPEWMWLFCFFVLMSGCTILLISILLLREVRNFVQKRDNAYI